MHCHGAALPDSVPVAHWHGVLGMGTWQYGTGMVQLDVWCGSAALPRAVTSCHVPLWHCHKIDRAIAALELNTPDRAQDVRSQKNDPHGTKTLGGNAPDGPPGGVAAS